MLIMLSSTGTRSVQLFAGAKGKYSPVDISTDFQRIEIKGDVNENSIIFDTSVSNWLAIRH